jgi:hypothetical protein
VVVRLGTHAKGLGGETAAGKFVLVLELVVPLLTWAVVMAGAAAIAIIVLLAVSSPLVPVPYLQRPLQASPLPQRLDHLHQRLQACYQLPHLQRRSQLTAHVVGKPHAKGRSTATAAVNTDIAEVLLPTAIQVVIRSLGHARAMHCQAAYHPVLRLRYLKMPSAVDLLAKRAKDRPSATVAANTDVSEVYFWLW